MTQPRYRYRHQQTRARLQPLVDAGEAYCTQPVCVMRSRWIPPGSLWDLAHDDSGTVTLGPAHRRCNRRDGAVRGNKMRARKPATTTTKPGNRWIL